MGKVRNRTWRNKAGEQSAWITQYSSPGPGGVHRPGEALGPHPRHGAKFPQHGTLPGDAQKAVSSLGSILADAMTTGRVARNVVREQARQNRRRNRVVREQDRRERTATMISLPTYRCDFASASHR
jgi:hypothetical protein